MLQIKTNNPSGHNVSICNTCRLPLSQRAVEGAEFVVAHGAPHLIDAAARQEKETVIDELHGSIRKLIGHGGHRRQLKTCLADGLDSLLKRERFDDAHLVHKALHFLLRTAARLLAARHQAVACQRQLELVAVPIGKRQAIEQVTDRRPVTGNAQAMARHLDNLVIALQAR